MSVTYSSDESPSKSHMALLTAGHELVQAFVVVLLTVAVVLKVEQLFVLHYLSDKAHFWDARLWTKLLVLLIESFTVTWILSGWQPHLSQLLCIGLFGTFAMASGWKSWIRWPVCGCFGSVSTSPLAGFWLDLVVVLLLIATWPASRLTANAKRWTESLRGVAFLACVVSLTVSVLWFGWAHAPFIIASGRVILVDDPVKDFGVLERGASVDRVFGLINLSPRPVHVLGAKTTCSCLEFPDLPLAIPGGAYVRLRARLVPADGMGVRGEYHAARLWLDAVNEPITLYARSRTNTTRLH
ncbi:MAG: hypothetical protein KatS3mg110_4637 [Pirellulaceae bacterium]|nr:MAG: hypothetical protein KatS3mg110_0003 [Pirellulaceae bacterium]GIW96596.1 MAG: hypothetical protein KatS3mg110_4637 [Pirellulaceae bacterium]